MRHFLFEDKEYKFHLNYRRRRPDNNFRDLIKHQKKIKSGGSGFKTDTRQKCIVKTHYSFNMKAHKTQIEKYLTRDGTDINGNAATLYGSDLNEYKKNMVDKNFRIFLSPQSNKIDLENLTKSFVRRLELESGYKLYWQAANHYNTAHPHSHILINGKDQKGRDVFFQPDLIKTFMRENARNICTVMIGGRTFSDLALEKEAQLTANRKIPLDEKIKELCNGGLVVNLDNVKIDKDRYIKRLEHLRFIGLCDLQTGGYKLKGKWEDVLKNTARYNMFLQARNSLRFTHASSLRVYTGDMGKIKGYVTKIYKTDDISNNHAVVLEGINGKAYFVPLFNKPKVREGDYISLQARENQKGRLTPRVYKIDAQEVYKEARKNKYDNSLFFHVKNERALKGERTERGGIKR